MSYEEDKIKTFCSSFGIDSSAFMKAGSSWDQVKKWLLYEFENQKRMNDDPRNNLANYDPREIIKRAMVDALSLSCGLRVEQPASYADNYKSYSLVELARDQLKLFRKSLGINAIDMFGRALTTTDFPYILENVANKIMLTAFDDESEETWHNWCDTGTVRDFKPFSITQGSEISSLEDINEHGEFHYLGMKDKKESGQLGTSGGLLHLSRHAMINDDTEAFKAIPKKLGAVAARKVGAKVYNVLTSNPTMSDGLPLFHADHNNLMGNGSLPDADSLGQMISSMKKQKGQLEDSYLNLRPRFFIAPVTLEGYSEKFFRSSLIGTMAEPGVDNPYSGNYFTRIYEPRLDDASEKAWYIAAQKGTSIKVYFLIGGEKPSLETQGGWTVDGIAWKARIDCTAQAVDWRGLSMNPGR